MPIHELAGKPAPPELLVNVPRLVSAYYTHKPDVGEPTQRVAFGTSGHRGSSLAGSFNEDHILAICQALCEVRAADGIDGPLYVGMDTHALSEAAFATAVEVFAANGVTIRIQEGAYTPTPVISHAILTYNAGRKSGLADGIIITPSHNPPEDGGFKYNPPNGGPANARTTQQIEDRANELMADRLNGIRRLPYERALRVGTTHSYDYVTPYVDDLARVIDMEAIAQSGLKIGVDPMGGAGIGYWDPIVEEYGLDLEVVNRRVDPTFSFMTVDHDGKIRMDCSSPYAMAGLIGLKDGFDIAYSYKPLHQPGLGHAFLNTLLYLDYDRKGFDYPVIPFAVNCYGSNVIRNRGGAITQMVNGVEMAKDPPGPSPKRCMELGAATARALQASPWRVALIASSSWSHAFLTPKNWWLYPDVESDLARFEELKAGNYEAWRNISNSQIEDAGQQEMLNWMCLAGAMSELNRPPEIIEFVQTYIFNSSKCLAVMKP